MTASLTNTRSLSVEHLEDRRLMAASVGFANGTMIAYIGIPPFIMTLALGFVNQGIIFTWTRGYPIYDGFTDSFLYLGIGYLILNPLHGVVNFDLFSCSAGGFMLASSESTPGASTHS